jgi:hypothetical protein
VTGGFADGAPKCSWLKGSFCDPRHTVSLEDLRTIRRMESKVSSLPMVAGISAVAIGMLALVLCTVAQYRDRASLRRAADARASVVVVDPALLPAVSWQDRELKRLEAEDRAAIH